MKKQTKELMWDVLADIAGGLFYALGIYTFAKTANFAPGGLSGLALITHHLWGLPIGIMTLVFNIPVIYSASDCLENGFCLKACVL